jgi:hypothetical protein
MSTTEFSKLGNSEETWTCPSCLKPNNLIGASELNDVCIEEWRIDA